LDDEGSSRNSEFQSGALHPGFDQVSVRPYQRTSELEPRATAANGLGPEDYSRRLMNLGTSSNGYADSSAMRAAELRFPFLNTNLGG
jgi:hypothetical protein